MVTVIIVIGVLLVVLLTASMWWDAIRREKYEPPRPDEQPEVPDHREHLEEIREADVDAFPPEGADRLLPYNMHTHSTHSTGKGRESRPDHGPNVGGGAFGSGGLGG
ncbi:DUF6479 family protein [Streptomyces katsurahamanus]|uniref:Secreted protein n=1 Tax=Streptomyces katsurahamanus TaxID=2577098 RepID=A0ABW9P2S3_9ACTN|nr:DUF6479 family protein [Streptomyces katsurahamanus]MQS39796.1 hypothetical protein [Streptomyces katsurahamanus]